ncbi:MAG: sorbosone dehydrogenase family protein [Thermoleophilia bacterium]
MRPPRSPRRVLALMAGAAAALALAACGGQGQADAEITTPARTTAGGAPTAAAPAREAATAGVRLAKVRGGLGDALFITGAPGQPGRLFIVQQSGRIRVLQNGKLVGRPFLDVSRLITSGGEQGLLGLAFHPDYARNGLFYVDYTDRSGNTRVVEYRRASATRANPSSARVLLGVDQPFPNHNGGMLAFGPDRMLYIGLGDGGSGDDPQDNAQNTNSLLGKILRIDVDGRSGGRPYGIPAGNPFADGGGRPEIFAYGLRNPWRFSFDRGNGDLWIGDVGQGSVEEIDHLARGTGAGTNFGWRAFEGRSVHIGGTGALEGPSGHTPPVAQYTHAQGCSVTGGYVYRGNKVPALRGRYVYADFCSGTVWSMRAGTNPGGVRRETGLGARLSNVTSFGESLSGDVYVIAGGALYRFVRG